MTKLSPSLRATTPPGGSRFRSRFAVAMSTASPVAAPNASLMALNWSMSTMMRLTGTGRCRSSKRPAISSCSPVRLGRPVSWSVRAAVVACSSLCRICRALRLPQTTRNQAQRPDQQQGGAEAGRDVADELQSRLILAPDERAHRRAVVGLDRLAGIPGRSPVRHPMQLAKAEVLAQPLGEALVDVFHGDEQHRRIGRGDGLACVRHDRRHDNRGGFALDRPRVGNGHVMLHGAVGHLDVGDDDIVLRLEVRMANSLQQIRQTRADGAIVRIRLARCHIAEHRRIIAGEHVDLVVAEEIAEILAIEGSHPAGVFVRASARTLPTTRSVRATRGPATTHADRWRARSCRAAAEAQCRRPRARRSAMKSRQRGSTRRRAPRSETSQKRWSAWAIIHPACRALRILAPPTCAEATEQAVI